MPIFGKGRQGRKLRQELLDRQVSRKASKTRVYRPRWHWSLDDSSFRLVAEAFPRVFGQGKNDFISQRFLEKKKPIAVLDWGCGSGTASSEIAEKQAGKARVYGFSKDSYREWASIRNVKFIHATAEDLLRYLKDNSVDLIYSYSGLSHYPIMASDSLSLPDYLARLGKKVSAGGKLVLTIQESASIERIMQTLGENFKAEDSKLMTGIKAVYITKLK